MRGKRKVALAVELNIYAQVSLYFTLFNKPEICKQNLNIYEQLILICCLKPKQAVHDFISLLLQKDRLAKQGLLDT